MQDFKLYLFKNRSRSCFNRALHKGLITRLSICDKCGSNIGVEAHHNDYHKPLEIVWLCRKCHRKIHSLDASEKKKKYFKCIDCGKERAATASPRCLHCFQKIMPQTRNMEIEDG